ARGHIAEANLFGKPVYPLIYMNYEGGANTSGKPISPEQWRTQLDVTRDLTSLAVVWGGWSSDAPWDIITRDFIATPDPLAVATPTTLDATSNTPSQRIGLTWLDRAHNETGYRIERKAAGELNFTPIANLPAHATAFTDDLAAPATLYTYRVLATGAAGDSPA